MKLQAKAKWSYQPVALKGEILLTHRLLILLPRLGMLYVFYIKELEEVPGDISWYHFLALVDV